MAPGLSGRSTGTLPKNKPKSSRSQSQRSVRETVPQLVGEKLLTYLCIYMLSSIIYINFFTAVISRLCLYNFLRTKLVLKCWCQYSSFFFQLKNYFQFLIVEKKLDIIQFLCLKLMQLF